MLALWEKIGSSHLKRVVVTPLCYSCLPGVSFSPAYPTHPSLFGGRKRRLIIQTGWLSRSIIIIISWGACSA
jgi:hypothetical protein